MRTYIHIPFCEKKCKYCRFALTISKKSKMKIYLEKLKDEIKKCDVKDKNLTSIYFGWWTPTSYSPEELWEIINELRYKFKFDKEIEFNLETTPFNITEENLEKWYNLGVNRLSMWIQSLNNKTLEEITRDNSEIIFKSLDLIEKSKIENLNIDFILWLPYIKKWETKEDIEVLLRKYKKIKWVSLYMLEDFEYPEKWEEISIKEKDFAWEYSSCIKMLEKYGFFRYELSNFTKKGFESKHNLGYWNHDEYIWFWLDASSFIWNKRWWNWDWFDKYYKWELEYEDFLTKEDLEFEKKIFNLRRWELTISEKIDLNWVEKMLSEGLIKIEWNKIKVTAEWIPLLDYIITEI